MPTYEVRLSRNAESYYKRCDSNTADRLKDCFRDLEELPKDWTHPRIKKLRGELSGLWRYRVGDFRVIYQVITEENIVEVVAIGSRGDVY